MRMSPRGRVPPSRVESRMGAVAWASGHRPPGSARRSRGANCGLMQHEAQNNGRGLAHQALRIHEKALSQPFRIGQRDEMTTGNFVHLLSEPFTRDTPLKIDREEAVVSSRLRCMAAA